MYSTPDVPPDPTSDTGETVAYARELRTLYRAAERRAARFRLLVEVGRDLTGARGLDAVLHLSLERATAFSGHDGGSVLLLNPSEILEVRASFGAAAVPPGTQVTNLLTSLSGRALAARRPLVQEGRYEEADSQQETVPHSAVCLPLIAADLRVLGVLALKSTTHIRRLDTDDLEALQLLASQLAAAVQNARLHEQNQQLFIQLAERERRLEELVGQILIAQEEERRRIAYELHDGLAQVAASAHQHLQSLAHQYQPRSPQRRQALERALDLAQRTVGEARAAIAGLRPTALDDFGLATALRLYIEQLHQDGWNLTYTETLGTERLPPLLETTLFRVAQEALTNARKHAYATQVQVLLQRVGAQVRLEVRDNGCGFTPTQQRSLVPSGEQIGLISMRERIARFGGRFQIKSQSGQGTHIIAELTVPQKE